MAAQARGTGRAKRAAQARETTPEPAAQARETTPEPAAQARDTAPEPAAPRPLALRLAAAAQAIEAVGLAVAAVFGAISTADGKSSQVASGIALTLFAFGTAAGLAAIAAGLAKARPWSRTPAMMTQLLVVIAGVVLLDGQRPEWGVPALLLAIVCVAALLTPASLRALNRPNVKSQ